MYNVVPLCRSSDDQCCVCMCPCVCSCVSPQALGHELQQLEAAQKKLNDKLMALTSRGGALSDIEQASLALADLQAKYEEKEERWLVLADIAGDI